MKDSTFKPPTSFENYLLSVGYVAHVSETNKVHGEYVLDMVVVDKYRLSTLGDLDYSYIKGDKRIVFGFNEQYKQPTIKWPRPVIKDELYMRDYALKNKIPSFQWDSDVSCFDDVMIKALHNYTDKEVLSAIFDRSITLDNDKFDR